MFASHSSASFDQWLGNILKELANDVQKALRENLIALILGGGYGRGEGGVLIENWLEKPYNDLDLTLIVRNPSIVSQENLNLIKLNYEGKLGIHVDFSRPLTPAQIRAWPNILMWHDLYQGHQVLSGKNDILSLLAPKRIYSSLPLIEATRLLLNRGTGLLWALRILRGCEKTPDPDFIRRNYFKCALALGDSLLITFGRYKVPYSGRDLLFQKLSSENQKVGFLALDSLYKEALCFKFRPNSTSLNPSTENDILDIVQKWKQVFLLVENERTRRKWIDLDTYCRWSGLREPSLSLPHLWIKNFVLNRRLNLWSWRYPRELLYPLLPQLLKPKEEISLVSWKESSQFFLSVWNNFN
ncbi:MAG: hypothetical protein HQM08_12570 [Candidatus Riflebacteria bacterium]|nr:hypothetical protein [Candidatus Riflebacteria bacterium]